jgi:hypothetical protein
LTGTEAIANTKEFQFLRQGKSFARRLCVGSAIAVSRFLQAASRLLSGYLWGQSFHGLRVPFRSETRRILPAGNAGTV